MTPIIIISGLAGSGKDTFADFLVEAGAVKIAQADPMKELVQKTYGLSDEQLWGASEFRNAQTITKPTGWLSGDDVIDWLKRILNTYDKHEVIEEAYEELWKWSIETSAKYHEINSITPRRILQTLGTEWGRNFSKNLWSDYAIRCARAMLGGGHTYDKHSGLKATPDPEIKVPDIAVISDGRFRNELLNVLCIGGISIQITKRDHDSRATDEAGIKGHASEAEMQNMCRHLYTYSISNNGTLADLKSKADALVYKIRHSTIDM